VTVRGVTVRGVALLRGIGVPFAAIAYAILAHGSNLAPTGRTLGVVLAVGPLLIFAIMLAWHTTYRVPCLLLMCVRLFPCKSVLVRAHAEIRVELSHSAGGGACRPSDHVLALARTRSHAALHSLGNRHARIAASRRCGVHEERNIGLDGLFRPDDDRAQCTVRVCASSRVVGVRELLHLPVDRRNVRCRIHGTRPLTAHPLHCPQ
jgi:hypothetical protein